MSRLVSSLFSIHSPITSIPGLFTKLNLSGTFGVTVMGLDKQRSQHRQVRRFIGGLKLLQVPLRSTPFSIASSVSRSFNKCKQAALTRACCGRYAP
jgi:hypothetical protein